MAIGSLSLRTLRTLMALVGTAALGLAACNSSDDGPNTPPQAVIESPAEGATFKWGDTLTFTGSATDTQDGPLGSSNVTWWVNLHHDTHFHTLIPPAAGASGVVSLPTRSETSDNVWLRFHLNAVDSAGLSTEVTRDVMPQKVHFTIASQPTGLSLTLDGQPFTAPRNITGVVGIERDLGAANQVFNGRNYQFSNWSDGGAATHTIATPSSTRVYTAVFVDAGPAINMPPTVALTAPANGSTGTVGVPITLTATASDSDGSVASVQFFDANTAIGSADTTAPYSVSWTPSAAGAHSLTARATDDGGGSTTSAAISVTINQAIGDVQPPTVQITAPAAFADDLAGTITFSANATDNVGVANVEFQVDGVPLATDTSSPYSATVDTNLYASGQHVLRVRASDTAGNRSNWSSVIVRFGGTRATPAGVTQNINWVLGLNMATAFTQLPDGRLLVAQQGGSVRVVQSDGTLLGPPMLTVTVDDFFDRGLLGITPHPNFASNGFIYIYYTTPQNGSHNRVSRFTVSGNTASNELVLIELPTLSAAIHHGGGLHFGIDGKLYVSVGENAVGANAQNLNTPLGKMLRLNDDGTIPGDNPFCTTQGNLACAVWAYGLRNPFTFAIQPGTGRMLINDVGDSSWEEINLGARGANYGWPSSEGPLNVGPGVTGPMFTYPHTAPSPPGTGPGGFLVGVCVIGGDFYPASGPLPAPWRGGYFFADFEARFIAFIDLQNDNAVYTFGNLPAIRRAVGLLVAKDGAILVLGQADITRFALQ
jgi:glucose/arabinose dehydrogenase